MSVLTTVESDCPYCGEACPLVIDPTEVGEELIEDCQVCCRPMRVMVSGADSDHGPDYEITLYREDE